MKTLTAEQVKRLPVGTDIRLVRNEDGKSGLLHIVKYGRQKRLKGVFTEPREIKDQPGWHFERVEDESKS